MNAAERLTAGLDVGPATATNDFERWGIVATGAALIAYGISRRSVPGVCFAAAATSVAYTGLGGRWPRAVTSLMAPGDRTDTRVALSGDRGIHVRESIRLEKPLSEVYRFWRRLENLPRFMTNLEQVIELGDGRSHWVAKGPAGVKIEWDAEIINEVEDEVIGLRSLPDADVVTAGSGHFDTVRAGRSTQITIHLQYSPPAGRLGAVVATIFGREPSQTIREDLRRLKQLLEAGEMPRTAAQVPSGSWR